MKIDIDFDDVELLVGLVRKQCDEYFKKIVEEKSSFKKEWFTIRFKNCERIIIRLQEALNNTYGSYRR